MEGFVVKSSVVFKRVLSLALVLAFLAVMAMPAFAVGQSATLAKKGDKYYVVANRLNMRTNAGMSYAVKAKLKQGTKVVFLSEKSGWWKIKLSSGKTGYVDKQFLTRYNVPKKGIYYTTAALNVRTEPKLRDNIIGTFKKGKKVKVDTLNGDWVHVNTISYTGWVASKYLKK